MARNHSTALKLAAATVAMFAFGFLLAPLYDRLCRSAQVTRYKAGDPVSPTLKPDPTRTIAVQYDANVHGALPWAFQPLQRSSQVHPGELVRVQYQITNDSDQAVMGQAVPSFAPPAAAPYFHKVECFCFTHQALGPRETRSVPVLFVIDAGIPRDMSTITLSYTFFEIGDATPAPSRLETTSGTVANTWGLRGVERTRG